MENSSIYKFFQYYNILSSKAWLIREVSNRCNKQQQGHQQELGQRREEMNKFKKAIQTSARTISISNGVGSSFSKENFSSSEREGH